MLDRRQGGAIEGRSDGHVPLPFEKGPFEHLAHDAGVDVVHHLHPGGAVEHERQPLECLLVTPHQREEFVGVEPGRRGDHQVVLARHDPAVLVDAGLIDATELVGQLGREDQPDRHRLAVREVVVGGDLQGVGQRVAVVEQRPPAVLAFVGGHHLGLDLDAAGDPIGEIHGEEIVTGEEVVLGHLAEPAAHLAGGQRVERVEVADHPGRLPERTDEVLALREVDGGLAADGRIDHAEQRGGDVHHRRAAVPAGGGEPGHVGDEASADADHHVVASETLAGEPTGQRLDRGQRLRLFGRTDLVHRGVEIRQVRLELDSRLGHHGGAARRGRQQRTQLADRLAAHDDVVRRIEGNRHARHRSSVPSGSSSSNGPRSPPVAITAAWRGRRRRCARTRRPSRRRTCVAPRPPPRGRPSSRRPHPSPAPR